MTDDIFDTMAVFPIIETGIQRCRFMERGMAYDVADGYYNMVVCTGG